MTLEIPNPDYITMVPKFVTDENGTVRGPFWYSNAWKNPNNHKAILFGTHMTEVQERLKKSAFNTTYKPPDIPIFLARDYIRHLETLEARWKDEAIEAKKELSKLKRLQSKS